MKRKLLITLFSLGTVTGFASAGAQWSRHHQRHRQAFEAHVARVCVDAARGVTERPAPPPEARPTPPPEARPTPPPQRDCDRRHRHPRRPHH